MKVLYFGRWTIVSAAIAVIAGCGGSEPPIGRPGMIPQKVAAATHPLSGLGYKTIFKFNSADGLIPTSLIALDGSLYGTTYGGGTNRAGTVFSVSTRGKGKVLHNFKGQPDGANPQAGLTELHGILYGTTHGGGASTRGTVFKITPSRKEQVIYSFQGGSDGEGPYAPLLAVGRALYGTTYFGEAAPIFVEIHGAA